jgi:ankyrin repeat protein
MAKQETQLSELRSLIEELQVQQALASDNTKTLLKHFQIDIVPVPAKPPRIMKESRSRSVEDYSMPEARKGHISRKPVAADSKKDGITMRLAKTNTIGLDLQHGHSDFQILQNQRCDAVQRMEYAQYGEAESILTNIIEKSEVLYGSEYYWRDTTQSMIVRAYWEQQKWDNAERLLLRIAKEQEQNDRLGESAETRHSLAIVALNKADYVWAQSYCQEALDTKMQLGNPWDYSVYVSIQLLVEILNTSKEHEKAATYQQKLLQEMWRKERNAITELCKMSGFKASVEIGANYLVDLLPSDESEEERWKQIRKNVRKRRWGLCGSGYGYNLFHAAVEFGQEDTVRYIFEIEHQARLLDLDCFVNVQDKEGNTPLHFAAAKGRLEIARLILTNGGDVNIKAKNLQTPLMVAAKAGCIHVVRLLLAYRPDLTAKDELEWTALHHAIFESQGEIIELLLKNGADVGCLGAIGRTPLHCAAVRGRQDIVRLLLEKGANPRIEDADGRTPLDLAEKHRNDRVFYILGGEGPMKLARHYSWT